MLIDYSYTQQAEAQLTVDAIGECAIEATGTLGRKWYMINTTKYGETESLTFGPVDDLPRLLEYYTFSYKRSAYKPDKLAALAEKFLNDPMKVVTEAKVVSTEEALSHYVDAANYLKGVANEN